MVSGLTPPSKRKDKYDMRRDLDELREMVRTGGSTIGVSAISGSSMSAGDTPITGSTAVGGMISLQPEVCYQSLIIKIKVTSTPFGTSAAHDLPIGGIIESSLTVSGKKWRGQLLFWLDEEAGTGEDGLNVKIGVFEPSNPAQLTFSNATQSFIQKDSDNTTISGWTADYVTGDTNEFNDKVLPIKTSTSIVERADGENAEVQIIKGSMSNGQVITLKPKEGKSLTLKAGGNIDISQDMTIADNEVAMLQMFWDATHSVKFTGGGGSGAKAVAYVEDDDGATTTAQKGRIKEVLVTHGGEGYTSTPTVTMEGGTGTIPPNSLTAVRDSSTNTITDVQTTNGDPVGSGWEQTGRFLLIKTQSSGATDTTIDYVWTGRHKFHADPQGTHPLYEDADELHTVEFGNSGTDRIMFIGEITGKGEASITDPDGGGSHTLPETDPSISVKSALVLNTYDIYDLDKLVFSQSVSSTAPDPEDDWYFIEANTGTGGASPSDTGMRYNVPNNKSHQFDTQLTTRIEIDESGILFKDIADTGSSQDFRIYKSAQYTNELSQNTNDLVFNVAENGGFRFIESSQTKALLTENNFKIGVPLELDSSQGRAYMTIKQESASAANPSSDLVSTSYDEARLFFDSGTDQLSVIKYVSGAYTVTSLEGGSAANPDLSNLSSTGEAHFANPSLSNLNSTGESKFVKIGQELTWTNKHVWDHGGSWSSNWTSDEDKADNCFAKFQGDGQEHSNYNYTSSHPAPFQRVLEIGRYGTHEVKMNATINGSGDAYITDPDGGGYRYIPGGPNSGIGDEWEESVSFKAAIIMNTFSIYDLDQLVFGVQGSTEKPPWDNDHWGIEVDGKRDNGTWGTKNMFFHVPENEYFQFNVDGDSAVKIGASDADDTGEILMTANATDNVQIRTRTGWNGGLDIKVKHENYNTIDFYAGNQNNYLFQANRYGLRIGTNGSTNGGYHIDFASNTSTSGYKTGGSGDSIYPDKWIRVLVDGSTYMYLPLYG